MLINRNFLIRGQIDHAGRVEIHRILYADVDCATGMARPLAFTDADVSDGATFCKLHWSTDLQSPTNPASQRLLNPGERVKMHTELGSFDLALRKVGRDSKGPFCLLDLNRATQ